MTGTEQSRVWLNQFFKAKAVAPRIAIDVEHKARLILQALGGIESNWRVNYPDTCYSVPQVINGKTIDLTKPEKVRAFYIK